MKKFGKSKIAIALLITLTLMMSVSTTFVSAAGVTVSVGIPAEVSAGSTIAISINIDTVTNLKTIQLEVAYNKDVLRITGNEGLGGVTSGLIGTTTMSVTSWKYSTPNTLGKILIKGQSSSPVSGQGSLAKINFAVIGVAGSKSDIVLSNVFLYDGSGAAITASMVNGTVPVMAPKTTTPPPTTTAPPPTTTTKPASATTTPSPGATAKTPSANAAAATAAATSSPTASPTKSSSAQGTAGTKINIASPKTVPAEEEFLARIDIIKVAALDSFRFILTYDPEVVEVVSVTAGEIGSTQADIKEWALTPPGEQGQVEVTGTLSGGKGVTGSGYLARVHCRMIGDPGMKSDLSLSDIELTAVSGDMIDIESALDAAVSSEVAGISVPEKIAPDAKFVADIRVNQVTSLVSYNIVVSYPSSMVKVTSVDPGLIDDIEVPVDDWDYTTPGKQGEIFIKGKFEDEGGVSGTGILAKISFQAKGRPDQKCPITLKTVELLDSEGTSLYTDPPVTDATVLLANPSFFSSMVGIIVIVVAAVVIIGVALFFVLRKLRGKGVKKAPSPARTPARIQKAETPEDLMDMMRNRVSQLPTRGRRPSDKDQPK